MRVRACSIEEVHLTPGEKRGRNYWIAMRKKRAGNDRIVLLLLFLVSIGVAILSLFQMNNTFAAILLGTVGVVYLIVRLLRFRH